MTLTTQYIGASEQTLVAIETLLGGVASQATLEAIRLLLTTAATEATLDQIKTLLTTGPATEATAQSILTVLGTSGIIMGAGPQRTAFGSSLTEHMFPIAGWAFPFSQNNSRFTSTTATGSGAAVTFTNGLANVACGTSSTGVASITTRRALRYVNGVGGRAVIAGGFTTGVADSTQLLGVGDANDGLFFGFNGVTFGINRRVGGTDNWTAQTSWNVVNPTTWAIPFDPTKGNVYMISFQWLGFGEIRFFIEDPTVGGFVLVHRIAYANQYTVTSLRNPQLPLIVEARNSGNTTSLAIFTASAMGFQEGDTNDILSLSWSTEATKTGVTTEAAILTLRNDTTHNSVTNRIRIHLQGISLYGEGTGNNVVTFRIRRDCTLTGTSYTAVSAVDSITSYDVAGTMTVAGTLLWSTKVGRNMGEHETLDSYDFVLVPGETFSITVESASTIAGSASIQWHEMW